MTTYILHGGRTKKDSIDNKLFFKQFTSLVPKDNVKILLCYWAREKETWNELFENDKLKILKQSTKNTEISMASTLESLARQLKEADCIIFFWWRRRIS